LKTNPAGTEFGQEEATPIFLMQSGQNPRIA